MKPTRRERRLVGDVRERLSGCPAADDLLAFVESDVDAPGEMESHVAACAACREAVSFLRDEATSETVDALLPSDVTRRSDELIDALSSPDEASTGPNSRGRWGWGIGIAAAAALAFIAIVPIWKNGSEPGVPELREPPGTETLSLTDTDRPLPRDAFILSWSAGPPGTRYDVSVLTEELRVVDRSQALDESRYQVPAEKLEGLSSGARVLWQVEARLPDGTRSESSTFVATLE